MVDLGTYFAAYVNGQRQGRIMEKPFCMGDIIGGESFTSEAPPRVLPTLDIEAEIELALDSKKSFKGGTLVQKMKELGLER